MGLPESSGSFARTVRYRSWNNHRRGAVNVLRPQSPHLHCVVRCQRAEMVRGNLRKTWIKSPPEQRDLVAGAFKSSPHLAFHPSGFLYGHLAKPPRPRHAEPRFWRHPPPVAPEIASVRATGESPLQGHLAMDQFISSWMRADNQFDGDGTHGLGIAVGCSAWCNQTMVTPPIFGRQWTLIRNRSFTAQTTFSPCSQLWRIDS